jgi:poly-gamma-glutamate system protein
MKKMYWTAYNFRPMVMMIMAIVAIFCLFLVENYKHLVPQEHYVVKFNAAKLSLEAMQAIKADRLRRGIKINKEFDPAETGLIGMKETPITSDYGVLRAKQISVNPNLAALIVQWLYDLNLKEGDTVAVGMTGSFPGIDISTLAALKVMGLKPILITSATASNWGANISYYQWLDMLHVLNKENIINVKPIASSIGADKDTGKNIEPQGIKAVLRAIKQYNIPLIREPLVSESIDKRLQLYAEAAGEDEIRAYINVGGGIASIGKHYAKPNLSKEQKELIKNSHLSTGPNIQLPVTLANTNSVAIRYLKLGVPVINIKNMTKIASDYSLTPWKKTMSIGIGALFFHEKYNISLAFLGLFLIIGACYWEMRMQRRRLQIEANEQLI